MTNLGNHHNTVNKPAWARMAGAVMMTALVAGCTLTDVSPPPLQGPSELGLSLQLSAIPDVLSLDGASQAQIIVQARDANSQPARITFRAEIQFTENGQTRIADCGGLSARTLTTGPDGRATLTYTAPMFACDEASQLVTIRVTPFGTDAANATPRTVDIRLVPPGVILAGGPRPAFAINGTPTTDGLGNPVPISLAPFVDATFDASASTGGAGAGITSYLWNFGDGTTAGGQIAVHRFNAPGQYAVRLTVSNTNGQSTTLLRTVTVEPGVGPTADFVFSPAEPGLNQPILFNGSLSTAGPGRTIVRYHWNFGSGAEQTGVTVTKSYDVAGNYTVVLTVTDDVGQASTVSKEVSVGP